MGVIKRGILGGFSGSVGNVVGSSWKGIATMKAKPLSVANPNTAAQQSQRTLMTNCVSFATRILTEIIKPLNDRFASGQSGFNSFVSRNIALFANSFPVLASDLSLSVGTVTPAENLGVVADRSANTVSVSFDNNTGVGDALATDESYIVVQNITKNLIITSVGTARNNSPATIVMPAEWDILDNIEVYLSFRKLDGSRVSNTANVAGAVVA